MKRVTPRANNNPYLYDCERIVEVFEKRGYSISITDAQTIWEDYSNSMAAGWLMLPADDNDLFSQAMCYAQVEDDDEEDEPNEW